MDVVAGEVPDEAVAADVRGLAAEVAAADGEPPLSDRALSRLRSPAATHVVARDGARLAGYAQLDGDSLEVAAHHAAVRPLLTSIGSAPVLVWSHGRRSRLAPVLDELGFVPVRTLHQLRRDLADPVADRAAPEGVRIEPFAPGRDEDAWLAVNAAAFADHPEQGAWTRADLAAREAEAWFDPAGFLLARRDDDVIGFHWTKVHPDGVGEVYVIGVHPSAQGLGLGGVLLDRGLRHLRARGCPAVLLYVDDANAGALRLYERTGFARYDHDIQWRSPGQASAGSESKT